MKQYATGSCRCGNVQFTAALPALWVSHCHCTLCQKSSGAAFVTWAAFRNDDYKIDDPCGFMKSYKSDKGGKAVLFELRNALWLSVCRGRPG